MTSLGFRCKDPYVAEYHERIFGAVFREALEQAGVIAPELASLMVKEAWRQEHYDYEIDAHGRRSPVYVDGIPKLLVPEIVVGP